MRGWCALQPVKTVPARRPAKARTARSKTGTRRAATTGSARGKSKAHGDDLRKRGPQDRARVNVHERWEVDYWCERFGVTPARLRAAVKKAGPMAKDVRRELRK